jgi:elongation factor 1-beta
MANTVVTLRIMPESPEVDLEHIKTLAEAKIDTFVGKPMLKQFEIKPVAFGLRSLDIFFMMDEAKGSPDPVADDIATIEGVQSAEVTGVNRPMG